MAHKVNIMLVLHLMLGKPGQMQKEHYLETAPKPQVYGAMWNLCPFLLHGYILINVLYHQLALVVVFLKLNMEVFGMYTLIAQDDLNTLGFSTRGLDGIFGRNTESAVKRYQTSRGLTSDRNCWLQYLAFSSRKRCRYSEELPQQLIKRRVAPPFILFYLIFLFSFYV